MKSAARTTHRVTVRGHEFLASRPEHVVRRAVRRACAHEATRTVIARDAGVTRSTVARWLRLSGIDVSPAAAYRAQSERAGTGAEFAEAAVRLYLGPPARSLDDVAAMLSRSFSAVRKAVLRAGVLRPRSSAYLDGTTRGLATARRARRARLICTYYVRLVSTGCRAPVRRTADEYGVNVITVRRALRSAYNPYPPEVWDSRLRRP